MQVLIRRVIQYACIARCDADYDGCLDSLLEISPAPAPCFRSFATGTIESEVITLFTCILLSPSSRGQEGSASRPAWSPEKLAVMDMLRSPRRLTRPTLGQ